MQNDGGVRKKYVEPERLLCIQPTFSHFVMASVGVSELGHMNLHFVDPDVKINGQYYHDTLLMRDLLPDIKQLSPDYFTLQQDGAQGAWNSQPAKSRVTRLHSSTSVAAK